MTVIDPDVVLSFLSNLKCNASLNDLSEKLFLCCVCCPVNETKLFKTLIIKVFIKAPMNTTKLGFHYAPIAFKDALHLKSKIL